ncbi:MAG: hypothetical protein HN758_15445 [Verrucomicrobia bacterium]|nr:hypothetical protein [Verrucomicrobiota bacterium]MBT4276527.1 hypothetical protein [Verrucomicrobiota bacterium]MBT5063577.1 hypothetical protein [Verrucomicrobiota bacterium]MBT5479012.1 hypothetical protein [Verrucomicrobiota bacterium]MBT6239884.1 hypothetical protein [Verrucomicrobiota bacterium]
MPKAILKFAAYRVPRAQGRDQEDVSFHSVGYRKRPILKLRVEWGSFSEEIQQGSVDQTDFGECVFNYLI